MLQSVVVYGAEVWDVNKDKTNCWQPKWITNEGAAGEQDQIEYAEKEDRNDGDGKGHCRRGAETTINTVWTY
jgi:hypothetical protein